MTVPFSLLVAGDVQGLAESIAAAGAVGGVVCIDTLNRAAPGADENSSQDMGLIIEAAKALQMALGGLVLLVHHTGKDAGKGLRGHSSLFAALDAAIEVSRDGDSRAWAVAKTGRTGRQRTSVPAGSGGAGRGWRRRADNVVCDCSRRSASRWQAWLQTAAIRQGSIGRTCWHRSTAPRRLQQCVTAGACKRRA